jgi:hypothetical protein
MRAQHFGAHGHEATGQVIQGIGASAKTVKEGYRQAHPLRQVPKNRDCINR